MTGEDGTVRLPAPVTTLAATMLLATCLVGCSSSPPEDASAEDFCQAYAHSATVKTPEQMQDWVDRLEQTGTPEDIPSDAKDGFDTVLELGSEADEDTTPATLGSQASLSDQGDLLALSTYARETCPEMAELMPS